MFFNATFAIDVSSTSMKVASITESVIHHGLIFVPEDRAFIIRVVECFTARSADPDLRRHRHPRPKHILRAGSRVQSDLHRCA